MAPVNKKNILLASFVGASAPLLLHGCGGNGSSDGTQNNEGAENSGDYGEYPDSNFTPSTVQHTKNDDDGTASVMVTAEGKPRMNIEYKLSPDKSKVHFSASLLSDEDRGAYLGVGLSKNGKMGTPDEPSDIFVCYSGYGRENVLSRHWIKGHQMEHGPDWTDGAFCDVEAGTMAWTMPVKAQNDKQRSINLSDDGPSMNNLIWAVGSGPTGYHKHRGDFDVDLTGATRQ